VTPHKHFEYTQDARHTARAVLAALRPRRAQRRHPTALGPAQERFGSGILRHKLTRQELGHLLHLLTCQ